MPTDTELQAEIAKHEPALEGLRKLRILNAGETEQVGHIDGFIQALERRVGAAREALAANARLTQTGYPSPITRIVPPGVLADLRQDEALIENALALFSAEMATTLNPKARTEPK